MFLYSARARHRQKRQVWEKYYVSFFHLFSYKTRLLRSDLRSDWLLNKSVLVSKTSGIFLQEKTPAFNRKHALNLFVCICIMYLMCFSSDESNKQISTHLERFFLHLHSFDWWQTVRFFGMRVGKTHATAFRKWQKSQSKMLFLQRSSNHKEFHNNVYQLYHILHRSYISQFTMASEDKNKWFKQITIICYEIL